VSAVAAAPARAPLADPATGFSLATEQDAGPDAGEIRHAFRIGQRWFLIPPELPAEACEPLACTRLPYTKAWCLGLANFRGDPVPIYDPQALWGDCDTGAGGYFLIVGQRDARAGLRIDEITGISVPVPAHHAPLPPLPGLPPALAHHGLTVDAITYAEIDPGALLALLAAGASVLAADPFASQDFP
jgi:hypothetical protein